MVRRPLLVTLPRAISPVSPGLPRGQRYVGTPGYLVAPGKRTFRRSDRKTGPTARGVSRRPGRSTNYRMRGQTIGKGSTAKFPGTCRLISPWLKPGALLRSFVIA